MKHDGIMAFALRVAALLWLAEAGLAMLDGDWIVVGVALTFSALSVTAVALGSKS